MRQSALAGEGGWNAQARDVDGRGPAVRGVCRGSSGSREPVGSQFSHPVAGRERQQPGSSRVGAGGDAVHPRCEDELRGRRRQDGRRARRLATSATGSSTTSARTSSPRTASRSGAGRGASSSTTTSACATRRRRRARRSPFDATDPLEAFRNDFGAIDFDRTPAAPGTGRDDAAAADQHDQQLHRRAPTSTASPTRGSTGCATATGRRQPGEQRARRCCCRTATCRAPTPAATRRPRPPMDLMGALVGDARRGGRSPATSARTRTSR